jgi:hypothetical protein
MAMLTRLFEVHPKDIASSSFFMIFFLYFMLHSLPLPSEASEDDCTVGLCVNPFRRSGTAEEG